MRKSSLLRRIRDVNDDPVRTLDEVVSAEHELRPRQPEKRLLARLLADRQVRESVLDDEVLVVREVVREGLLHAQSRELAFRGGVDLLATPLHEVALRVRELL